MHTAILALATVVCGFGQQPMLDAYGNSICRDVQTSHVRKIDGGLGSACPTGTMPMLTPQGKACVGKDDSVRYFDNATGRGACPIGTYPGLDPKGNLGCLQ